MLTVVGIKWEEAQEAMDGDKPELAKKMWQDAQDYAQDWVDAKLLEQRRRIVEIMEGLRIVPKNPLQSDPSSSLTAGSNPRRE